MVAGFCKQQLWPLFHYLLPLSPTSTGRFNPELWQAYVKANKVSTPCLLRSQGEPGHALQRGWLSSLQPGRKLVLPNLRYTPAHTFKHCYILAEGSVPWLAGPS